MIPLDTPPDVIVILSLLAGIIGTIGGNFILSRADNRRVPSDNRNTDSETYRNLLATTQEATQALKQVREENSKIIEENEEIKRENEEIKKENLQIKQENKRIIQLLSGTHRMVFEFSLSDFVQQGEAHITSGKLMALEKD